MAVAAGANPGLQTGNAEYPGPAQNNGQEFDTNAVSEWQANSPSYLPQLQKLLAGLTEEDKDAIHASLEEE